MKLFGVVAVLLVSAALSGCNTVGKHFRNAFVDNYNGAGQFLKLVQGDDDVAEKVDSPNQEQGFDSICILHVKIFDRSRQETIWEQVRGAPEVHYGLTDEFIHSDEQIKEDIRWRGDLARYFKDHVHGRWTEGIYGKYYDAMSVVGVRSRIGAAIIQNAYVRFWSDRWMTIPIGVEFAIEPGQIYYLGTLEINLKQDSNREITGTSSLRIIAGDPQKDMSYIERHFPQLFRRMHRTFTVPEWI